MSISPKRELDADAVGYYETAREGESSTRSVRDHPVGKTLPVPSAELPEKALQSSQSLLSKGSEELWEVHCDFDVDNGDNEVLYYYSAEDGTKRYEILDEESYAASTAFGEEAGEFEEDFCEAHMFFNVYNAYGEREMWRALPDEYEGFNPLTGELRWGKGECGGEPDLCSADAVSVVRRLLKARASVWVSVPDGEAPLLSAGRRNVMGVVIGEKNFYNKLSAGDDKYWSISLRDRGAP